MAVILLDIDTDEVLHSLGLFSSKVGNDTTTICVPTCQCQGAAEHSNQKYVAIYGQIFGHRYLPTATKDGYLCDFCGYAVFWDKKTIAKKTKV